MPPSVQIAIAQFMPRKGAYAANLEHLRALFAQVDAMEPRPAVLQLPETALTGYFVEGGVRELAMTAQTLARDLHEIYQRAVPGGRPLDVVIGFYEVWNNTLYNSAMYVRLGAVEPAILHVHRKTFLPTYSLFDEERFVERGHDVRAFDTPWGRAAMLVCEDAWHSLTGTLAALDGAQVVFISAAAPARGIGPGDTGRVEPGSIARWERLVRDIADEHGVFVSLACLVGSEGGKTFAGGSLVAGPSGDVRARAPLWDDAVVSLSADLGDLTRARANMPLLADLRTALPHLLDSLDRIHEHVPPVVAYDGVQEHRAPLCAPSEGAVTSTSAPTPLQAASACDAGARDPLAIDGELTDAWLTHFVRQELAHRGYTRGIVALSGGVDSSVTAYLAARAIGAENVIGVRLPYRTSSAESIEHAQLVIDALGITARTLDISPAVDGYLAQEPDADATRRGNVMARTRMIALFDLSAKLHALPLGTGNKTERLLGYFTWHADDSPPINPIGDLYKTQVWALARHLGVPEAIIHKPASADLVRGQTDEADLGISYPKADQILHWLLSGYSVSDLVARGFTREEVEVVRRRLEGTHWKRRLPTVAMLSATAIGESYLRPVDY
ncbi:MAG TPA: NAD+ synthase [Gemmatimonadaceae bacterium]|nr:NAD+ synthase [Gemmatimonadaceae bacterium]